MIYVSILACALELFFFFNDTATTEIYTLSLHDALPICSRLAVKADRSALAVAPGPSCTTASACSSAPSSLRQASQDRKSTRLNSSHANISYAVFCLKKKKNMN